MTDLLSDGSISILRIGLEISATSSSVRLRLVDAVPFDRDVPCEEFGFDTSVPASSDPVPLGVPATTRTELGAAVNRRTDPAAPLWLEFVPPYGALAAIPWERDLEPLQVPVLRLPPLSVPAVGRTGQLRVAIIGSAPRAKTEFSLPDLVVRTIEAIQSATSPPATVDVFVDADSVEEVERRAGRAPAADRVRVHHPPRPAESAGSSTGDEAATPTISATEQVASPWLQWVLNTIGSEVVDVVQFICPGYRSLDNGALALARTPAENDDPRLARFVGASELTTFLRHTGAWCVQLSDATNDQWTIGLSLLLDELAQLRPGTAALLNPRVGRERLTSQLRFLLGEGSPQVSGDVVYCHPAVVTGGPDWASLVNVASELLRHSVESLTVATDAQDATSGGELAGWVSSAQRLLEERVGVLLRSAVLPEASAEVAEPSYTFEAYEYADGDYPPQEEGTSSGDTAAADRGAADAIQFVASLVADQVRVVS